jgi:hypothetical protein
MSATSQAVSLAAANMAAGGFGNSQSIKRGMDDYVLTLDGVTEQFINVAGDFYHCQTVPTNPVQLRFDDGKQVTRRQGQGGRRVYSRVGVFAAVAQTVTIQLGYGTATDANANVTATITAPIAPALNNPPTPSVTVGAGLQALLVAADANMLEVGVKNPSTAAGGVFLADNTAAVDLGYFLEPGEGVWIGTQAAVYAFNPNGAAVKLSLLRTRKI